MPAPSLAALAQRAHWVHLTVHLELRRLVIPLPLDTRLHVTVDDGEVRVTPLVGALPRTRALVPVPLVGIVATAILGFVGATPLAWAFGLLTFGALALSVARLWVTERAETRLLLLAAMLRQEHALWRSGRLRTGRTPPERRRTPDADGPARLRRT
jgi:hypothetical protein